MFVKGDKARAVALGLGGAGVLDIVRQNVPSLVPMSAEDAGYLLGSAAQSDAHLAAMLGAANAGVPGVLPNIFGAANAGVPGVLPNVFGVDTAKVPMGDDEAEFFGVDTAEVPMGDEEGESLFAASWL